MVANEEGSGVRAHTRPHGARGETQLDSPEPPKPALQIATTNYLACEVSFLQRPVIERTSGDSFQLYLQSLTAETTIKISVYGLRTSFCVRKEAQDLREPPLTAWETVSHQGSCSCLVGGLENVGWTDWVLQSNACESFPLGNLIWVLHFKHLSQIFEWKTGGNTAQGNTALHRMFLASSAELRTRCCSCCNWSHRGWNSPLLLHQLNQFQLQMNLLCHVQLNNVKYNCTVKKIKVLY